MKYTTKDLIEKNPAELMSVLDGERARLAEIRMKLHVAPPKNVKEIREIRKNIARVMTLLSAQK